MKQEVRTAFSREMAIAKAAFAVADYTTAFHHLERAHILGQRYFLTHWTTHWWMLRTGLRRKDGREIRGQVMRLVAVVPGYLFGWIPKGNPGGANVSALRPMPIPEDLRPLLKDYSVARDVLGRVAVFAAAALLVLGVLRAP